MVRLSECSKKDVDRCPSLCRRFYRRNLDLAVLYREAFIRRHHIYVVRLDLCRSIHLRDRHAGRMLEHLGQPAVVVRREMKYDHVSDPGIDRSAFKEILESLDASCRCTNAHDQEIVL